MSTGAWLVLCPATRALPMWVIAERVPLPRDATGRLDVDQWRVTAPDPARGDTVEVTVSLSTAPHVVDEAAELVERFGVDRPDREAVAGYDARYEIVWQLERSDATFHVVASIAGKLQSMCEAVIFDSTDGTFV